MKFFIAAVLTMLLGGCAGLPPTMGGGYQSSADRYTVGQAQSVGQVNLGTVLVARRVLIAAPESATAPGSALGALAGYYAGSQIGSGNGRRAAALIGALAGAAGGQYVAGSAYQQPGLQITVRLDNGQIVSVTQAADIPFSVGERVELITGGWGQPARVMPL